ncbi:MAG: hypothetical protein HQK96_07540 [Nitrospirae bacterium]|nr:hypothetical protein [Nitrospirota bacterium]
MSLNNYIGILYSQEIYNSFPDPLSLLDDGFRDKVAGGIIKDLYVKISKLGGDVVLIEENDITNAEMQEKINKTKVIYTFPLLGYVEGNPQILEALSLLNENGRLFNSLYSLENAADKIRTAHIFKEYGVAIPETLFTHSVEEAIEFVQNHHLVVIKPKIGSEGMGVAFLRWDKNTNKVIMDSGESKQKTVDFDSTKINQNPRISYHLNKSSDKEVTLNAPFFLQKYVNTQNSNQFILKIYVLDGEATSGIKIINDTTKESVISYNNIGQNNTRQELYLAEELPLEASDLACQATTALELRSGLVDVIWSAKEKKWKVLEVNNDDFGKIRDRSERIHLRYKENGPFDWNYKLANALLNVAKSNI